MARLTGGRVHVTDHTNASRTLLYDLAARDWSPELLELFGVPREILPGVALKGELGALRLGQPKILEDRFRVEAHLQGRAEMEVKGLAEHLTRMR